MGRKGGKEEGSKVMGGEGMRREEKLLLFLEVLQEKFRTKDRLDLQDCLN
jgi:hypothetical protein